MRWYFIFIVLIAFSCDGVHFNRDFPSNVNALNEFDSRYVGKYYLKDSVYKLSKGIFNNTLYFDENSNMKDSFHVFTIQMSVSKKTLIYSISFASYYNLSIVDTMLLKSKHEFSKNRIEKEFYVCEEKLEDTLINLKLGDKLKFYNGAYYLNRKITKNEWEIFQVLVNKEGTICVKQTNKMDEESLSHTFFGENRIFGNIAQLSNDQFIYFVKKGGFRNKKLFIRKGTTEK